MTARRYAPSMSFEAVILAAGLGTRLGRPHPKPLTRLSSGETIMDQQVQNLRHVFGERTRITAVVGFKLDLVIEANPDLSFAYNEMYDVTNTSKSLLKAFRVTGDAGVLWLNGDVVFDRLILEELRPHLDGGISFACVNTAEVAEEEVKYTLDEHGRVAELSKTVVGGLGEAVGINFVSSSDKAVVEKRLHECADQDYFERGLELAIEHDGLKLWPVDISAYGCVEVDVQSDLDRANSFLS